MHNSTSLTQTAQILIIIQYIFNVVHLFVNVYFTYGIYSTSLIHPNLKTLIVRPLLLFTNNPKMFRSQ
jgi:hypothetical protein